MTDLVINKRSHRRWDMMLLQFLMISLSHYLIIFKQLFAQVANPPIVLIEKRL